MTNGDPEIKKKMEGYWKMLDEMSAGNPEEYKKFVDGQMEEMRAYDREETKKEEKKWEISSTPYFAFSVRPSKILDHNKNQAPSQDNDIRLFDFG